jgi:hypothetical protein
MIERAAIADEGRIGLRLRASDRMRGGRSQEQQSTGPGEHQANEVTMPFVKLRFFSATRYAGNENAGAEDHLR